MSASLQDTLVGLWNDYKLRLKQQFLQIPELSFATTESAKPDLSLDGTDDLDQIPDLEMRGPSARVAEGEVKRQAEKEGKASFETKGIQELESLVASKQKELFLQLHDAYVAAGPAKKNQSVRILPERTPFERQQQHIDHYYKIFSENRRYPSTAALALLIANFHHLQEYCLQPSAHVEGLISYLRYQVQRKTGLKLSRDVADNIFQLLNEVFGFKKDSRTFKLMSYNKTLPVDMFEQPHIQALRKQGFELQEVEVREQNISADKMKKMTIPDKYCTLSRNVIVIDRKTRKVLAILCKNDISAETAKTIRDCIEQSKGDHAWNRSKRSAKKNKTTHKALTAALNARMLEKETSAETKGKHEADIEALSSGIINRGQQMTLGLMNFYMKEKNTLATNHAVSKHSRNIWNQIKAHLIPEVVARYKTLMPIAYNSSVNVSQAIRQEYPNEWMHPESPFGTLSLNLKNAVRPHRDLNMHNYSAMVVFSLDGKTSTAGTCFSEWIDPKTQLPVEVIVDNGDLLIADTDYIHYARNVTTDRVSIVFYTYKKLRRNPILACEDSDVEETAYEPPIHQAPMIFSPKTYHYDEGVELVFGNVAGAENQLKRKIIDTVKLTERGTLKLQFKKARIAAPQEPILFSAAAAATAAGDPLLNVGTGPLATLAVAAPGLQQAPAEVHKSLAMDCT